MMEIYSPPGCKKCGDRAFRQIIGSTDAYCRAHWRKLPGEELVSEYEQHIYALRGQGAKLKEANSVLMEAVEKAYEYYDTDPLKCETEMRNILREAFHKAKAIQEGGA